MNMNQDPKVWKGRDVFDLSDIVVIRNEKGDVFLRGMAHEGMVASDEDSCILFSKEGAHDFAKWVLQHETVDDNQK